MTHDSVRLTFVLLLLAGLLLGGCGSPAGPPVSPTDNSARTPTPVPASDEEAIQGLLRAEGEAVVQQDMERLAELWTEDAVVRDAKHTPQNEEDDAVWRGIDAVLDRYVVLVFPGNPQLVAPQVVSMEVQGDEARVVSTTQIGEEVSPKGDVWTFVRQDGRWWIASLTYNLEP
ncbi:MAG: DUF4440 domain-containing protein [Chloroflexi bacterium]|nr:DUF4440 domain-containing protein [Chloroflexota bacterium]